MHAVQHGAEHGPATFFGYNPGPVLPGRIVPHVLRVAAFQVGDPVVFLVGVEADDPPRNTACPVQLAGESYTLGIHRSR